MPCATTVCNRLEPRGPAEAGAGAGFVLTCCLRPYTLGARLACLPSTYCFQSPCYLAPWQQPSAYFHVTWQAGMGASLVMHHRLHSERPAASAAAPVQPQIAWCA